MKIKLIKQYLNHPPGSVVTSYGAGVSRELIRRGVAKPVNPKAARSK